MAKRNQQTATATPSASAGRSLPAPLPTSGYVTLRLDTRLTQPQAEALKGLAAAMDHRKDTLQTGKRVTTGADAVRWILENLAELVSGTPGTSGAPDNLPPSDA